jgi:hypothetical protein
MEKQWLQAADFFADEECISRLAVAFDEKLLAPSAEALKGELLKVCSWPPAFCVQPEVVP